MPPRSTTRPRSLWWYCFSGRPRSGRHHVVRRVPALADRVLGGRRADRVVALGQVGDRRGVAEGEHAVRPGHRQVGVDHQPAADRSRRPGWRSAGSAATPAVQIRVRQGSTRPSVRVTLSSVASATRRRARRRCRACAASPARCSPSLSPSSGMSLRRDVDQVPLDQAGVQPRVALHARRWSAAAGRRPSRCPRSRRRPPRTAAGTRARRRRRLASARSSWEITWSRM